MQKVKNFSRNKKILIGILLVGIVLIFGWLVSNNQPIPIQQSKYIEISIDEKFERISNVQLPIDRTEAETIVKQFCESKNQDYSYGYDIIKEIDNEWRIQIVNMNGMCYAAVNVKSGETNCEKCDDVKLFPPFEQATITTDKTEYEQGEMLKVTVRNNRTKSVWFMEQGCNHRWWKIEKQQNENWKLVSLTLPYIIGSKETCPNCIASPLPFELKPKSEISYEWNLRCCKNSNPALFESGLYRLCFMYKPSKDIYEGKTIYSNEFAIKEKKEVETENICEKKCKSEGFSTGRCSYYGCLEGESSLISLLKGKEQQEIQKGCGPYPEPEIPSQWDCCCK